MDEQIEALAEVLHDAFHGPWLNVDFDGWIEANRDNEEAAFALPWVLQADGRAKDNFRRAAKAALDHLGANGGEGMSEPCVCDGSGIQDGEPCHWCNAGDAHRKAGTPTQLPHIVWNPNKRTYPASQNRYVFAAPITWTADHKDTTEPHE